MPVPCRLDKSLLEAAPDPIYPIGAQETVPLGQNTGMRDTALYTEHILMSQVRPGAFLACMDTVPLHP